ncbi:MAG: hypothetical protein CMI30_08395 [Opitutae bacterium]|nr:hypothetical protein [Opitutae bacterium]|tara:strand:- start:3406 stop:3978 length:573 start_codon:yes stop_codon:yes gene_type:complete
MEGKMSETNEQEEMKTNELAGMQFANVELTLSEMQTGPITHLADESGSNSGLGQLAKLGAEGFSLVAVTPKENGRALAFLQRPVQTERELNFIRNAFLLEDILQIEVEDFPKVIDAIDVDDLIVALKPASDALRKLFFDALPEKASLSLQEQIEFLMPKSLRAAEAAQERVLRAVKSLIRSKEVSLQSND